MLAEERAQWLLLIITFLVCIVLVAFFALAYFLTCDSLNEKRPSLEEYMLSHKNVEVIHE